MKIGYAISPNVGIAHPAYRRRFGFYLKNISAQWEIANPKESYDLVVVHHSADLTRWIDYKNGKIILDYNDDYLSVEMSSGRALARGCVKFASGQWSKFYPDFRKVYVAMMQRADAVVCCTRKQAVDASRYCKTIRCIVDMQPDDGWLAKTDYDRQTIGNLVWEGLPAFDGLKTIAAQLGAVARESGVALHVISSLRHGRYLNTLFPEAIDQKLKRISLPLPTYLYEWNEFMFPSLVRACDLAIIPINMEDPFWLGKPINKLLFFWRLGMPVLASSTPEYEYAMNECGLSDMLCRNADDWCPKIRKYMGDTKLRESAGKAGNAYARAQFSNERLLQLWDELIRNVVYKI